MVSNQIQSHYTEIILFILQKADQNSPTSSELKVAKLQLI